MVMIWNVLLAELSNASTALIVKLYEPIVVGIPETTPVLEFKDRPGGGLPDKMDRA